MPFSLNTELPLSVLEILPNPVLVKNADLRYVWVNPAFEALFGVRSQDLRGQLDVDVFKDRQAVQCMGGDRRVLESGNVDEAYETVFESDGTPRETITRKSRLILTDGSRFLVGVMHDVTDVTRANDQLTASQTQLQAQSDELQRLANTDPLTDCLNRRAIFEQAPRVIHDNEGDWALHALDIDHFKAINDTYGHDAGDAALVHFANTVRRTMRKADLFTRLGGEEFAVVLPQVNESESAQVAQRLCDLVATSPCRLGDITIPMTISIGTVCGSTATPFNLDTALKLADGALYQAKEQGRNRFIKAAA